MFRAALDQLRRRTWGSGRSATNLSMAQTPKVYIVCSDRARIGKTLLARLYADYLILVGRDPFIFDCDGPHGGIARYYGNRAEMVDLDRVKGQIALFDAILANPGRDYVIDLPSRHIRKFFIVLDEIGFAHEAHKNGLEFVALFIAEQYLSSLKAARELALQKIVDRFIAARNENFWSPDEDENISKLYFELAAGGEVVVPRLDTELKHYIEDDDFTFHAFVSGEMGLIPEAARIDLLDFLIPVYRQIKGLQFRSDLDELRRAGFV